MTALTPDDLTGLVRARRERPYWHPLSEGARPADEAAGYALQAQIHRHLAANGIARVGYKIGSTSPEGQRALGLAGPVYAGMYTTTHAATLREALALPLASPSVECEIAFVLARAIGADQDLSDDALAAAVQSAHLACEVVDNRYGSPLDIGMPTILTDDFFHAAFILGPPCPQWRDLLRHDLPGAIEIDGRVVHGTTASVLHPFAALRWLVERLALQGEQLNAGQTILTGSLVTPTRITLPAQSVAISVEGFGALRLSD